MPTSVPTVGQNYLNYTNGSLYSGKYGVHTAPNGAQLLFSANDKFYTYDYPGGNRRPNKAFQTCVQCQPPYEADACFLEETALFNYSRLHKKNATCNETDYGNNY